MLSRLAPALPMRFPHLPTVEPDSCLVPSEREKSETLRKRDKLTSRTFARSRSALSVRDHHGEKSSRLTFQTLLNQWYTDCPDESQDDGFLVTCTALLRGLISREIDRSGRERRTVWYPDDERNGEREGARA